MAWPNLLMRTSPAQWREIFAAFPAAAKTPVPTLRLLFCRLRIGILGRVAHRWPALIRVQWEGLPPDPAVPTIYATAHIGQIRGLRRLLARRGVPMTTVIRAKEPLPYGEAVPTTPVSGPDVTARRISVTRDHKFLIRNLLKTESLLIAADVPAGGGIASPILGGEVLLDPRPFRLARLAGVACRPAFLTVPRGRLTVTLGPPLRGESVEADVRLFGETLAHIAARVPGEIDGSIFLCHARRRGPARNPLQDAVSKEQREC